MGFYFMWILDFLCKSLLEALSFSRHKSFTEGRTKFLADSFLLADEQARIKFPSFSRNDRGNRDRQILTRYTRKEVKEL